ncbi:MAG TPA: hypothetical protein VH143_32820 [Kofleriaceae bacterium]|jgi:hypothetical protein|nr:hypothetical protein [Kofleriaceae bacterium]
MADGKNTTLSITIRTIDQATAKIKAINDRLDKATKPARDFGKALSDFKDKSGLGMVAGAFSTIGGAVKDAVGDVLEIGSVIAGFAVAATGELIHLVNQFDDLGKKAQRLGVGVDFLAEMRFAAEKTGVPLDELDSGLQAFNENLGQARAGMGRMAKFVGNVSPALLTQLKAAKGNAAAFDLLARAMSKVTDPAERAALAQKTVGDSNLAPLFQKGAAGIAELRKQYDALHGSNQGAVEASEKSKSAMVDLGAAVDGAKAALVEGLSPALTVIVKQLTDWLVGHRKDIKEWAERVGKWLPGAINGFVDGLVDAYGRVKTFFKDTWDFIKPIIDAIHDAVGDVGDYIDKVKSIGGGALGAVGNVLGGPFSIGSAVDKIQDEHDRNAPTPIAGVMAGITNVLGPAAAAQMALARASMLPDANPAFLAPSAGPNAADAVVGNFRAWQQPTAQQQQQQAALAPPPQSAKITIDIAGAPRGTRVREAPGNTADVDMNVGYQMSFAP